MTTLTHRFAALLALLVSALTGAVDGFLARTLVMPEWLHRAGILNAGGKDLKAIIARMQEIDKEYDGKAMPQNIGEEYEQLAQEGAQLQEEAKRKKQLKEVEAFGREVPEPNLPADSKTRDDEVVGYLPLSVAVTATPEYKTFLDLGCPGGMPADFLRVKGGLHGQRRWGSGPTDRFIPLTRKGRAELEAQIESKAVATIADAVIEPQRLAEVVRATEQDVLRLRDIMNVSRTTSPSIEWVKITSVTRAAAPVAPSALKPEATMEVDTETTTVKTLAVWMPVTEQQLRDTPQLQNMIDIELLYDVRKVEEEEIMYGTGAGQHLPGILRAGSGVIAARTEAGDSITDQIRRAITDVRRSGYAPNGVAIDPLDWEEVVLQKGTDGHYLYQVFPTEDGTPRIWSLRVVETVAAEELAGNTTEQRNIVVGDWLRGATLFDYQDAVVGVGWINDQYVKNQRTVRAEERVGLALKRPLAFRKIQTQAAVA